MSSQKITLECPFDLETVFTLQYSTEGLKGVLKWIIDNLGDLNKKISDVDSRLLAKIAQIEKNTGGVGKNAEDISKIRQVAAELEAKSIEEEKRVSDLNITVENLTMNVSLQHRTTLGLIEDHKELIDQHTAEIEELKKKVGQPIEMPEISGDGLDMAQLMNLFASKNPPDNTINRIEELERQMKQALAGSGAGTGLDADAMDKLNDLLRRVQSLETRADKTDRRQDQAEEKLADHERRIAALEAMGTPAPIVADGGKIDTNAIMQQIQLVRSELSQVRSEFQAFSTKTTADLEALRLELKGYTNQEIEALKKQLTKKIEDSMETLKYELDRLRAEFETFKSKDFRDLEARVSALEKRFQRLSEAFANLKIPESSGNGGVSQEAFNQLQNRVAQLEADLDLLRNEFAKWMKEMQDSLNTKADFAQMDKALQDRLSDIVKALTKQFADKGDTRKALKIHEKQFQNLYNLIMSKGGNGENEEDAMFSKKPLGGLSCASCEKGLIDMYGKRVEFMPWNKLPFRDPAERIARVGQGFSKMLSMINPDQLSRYEQQNSKMAHPQQPMHMSQNEPMTNGQEQFYDPNAAQDMGGRTHSRFPQQNQRFTSGEKRPGSAQQRKQMRSKQRKM